MRTLASLLLLTAPLVAIQPSTSEIASAIIGNEWTYQTRAGDTLTNIGARVGVDAVVLARRNGLRAGQRLAVGQTLTIDDRHIMPAATAESIVINVPQRLLFQFRDGVLHATYPVGLGRPTWPTPLGAFTVIEREENPTWHVPPSIQAEMRQQGKPVITIMPPCPANPLGKYRLRLSLPGVGIHGTIAPSSIYQFQTHGCIRLHPDDICSLFGEVQVGDTGRIIYEPVLLARLPDGRIFVEVHRDIYRRARSPLDILEEAADRAGVTGEIDWDAANAAIELHEGVAIDVTRGTPAPTTTPTAALRLAYLRQTAPPPDGAALYKAHCASCHGSSGRGDGPVAEFLKMPPADLTQIVKQARGAFPAAQLVRIIDGRQLVRAHGDSKMPVWGDAFSHSLTRADDAAVRQKIDALVKYLQSIQERQARRDEPRNLPQGHGISRTRAASTAASRRFSRPIADVRMPDALARRVPSRRSTAAS